jgi:hypothetical protein
MADSAITLASGEVRTHYSVRIPNLKQRRAAEWRGTCPIHHGKNDNFAVEPNTGRWFCHSTCGRGGDFLTRTPARLRPHMRRALRICADPLDSKSPHPAGPNPPVSHPSVLPGEQLGMQFRRSLVRAERAGCTIRGG